MSASPAVVWVGDVAYRECQLIDCIRVHARTERQATQRIAVEFLARGYDEPDWTVKNIRREDGE